MTKSKITRQSKGPANRDISKLNESAPATSSLATLGTVHLDKTDWGVVGEQS